MLGAMLEHVRLMFDVFWRHVGTYFGACLIDVGAMVVSTWEVFWSYIKDMSDVYWRWYQKYFYCIWAGILEKSWRQTQRCLLQKCESPVRLLSD